MPVYFVIAVSVAVVLLCVFSFRRFECGAKDFNDVARRAAQVTADSSKIHLLHKATAVSESLVYRSRLLPCGDAEIDDITNSIQSLAYHFRIKTLASYPYVYLGVFKETTLGYIGDVSGDYKKLRQLASDLCIIVEPDNLSTLEAALR